MDFWEAIAWIYSLCSLQVSTRRWELKMPQSVAIVVSYGSTNNSQLKLSLSKLCWNHLRWWDVFIFCISAMGEQNTPASTSTAGLFRFVSSPTLWDCNSSCERRVYMSINCMLTSQKWPSAKMLFGPQNNVLFQVIMVRKRILIYVAFAFDFSAHFFPAKCTQHLELSRTGIRRSPTDLCSLTQRKLRKRSVKLHLHETEEAWKVGPPGLHFHDK